MRRRASEEGDGVRLGMKGLALCGDLIGAVWMVEIRVAGDGEGRGSVDVVVG